MAAIGTDGPSLKPRSTTSHDASVGKPRPIPADVLDSYTKDGYMILRNVFTEAEVAELRPPRVGAKEAASARADPTIGERLCFAHPVGNAAGDKEESKEPEKVERADSPAGERVVNKIEQSSVLPAPYDRLFRLALDKRCVSIARQALQAIRRSEQSAGDDADEAAAAAPPSVDEHHDQESICLLKDKLVLKLPGGPGFTPHVDLTYGWHRFASRVVNVAVSFDASDVENSAIQVARAAHAGPQLVADEARGTECELPSDFDSELRYEHLETGPGDVYVFTGRTPHRSEPNASDRDRTVFYASYALASDCAPLCFGGGTGADCAAPLPAAAVWGGGKSKPGAESSEPKTVPERAAAAQALADSAGVGLGPYWAYYQYYWAWTDVTRGNFSPGWAGMDGSLGSLVPVATSEQRASLIAANRRRWEEVVAGGKAVGGEAAPGEGKEEEAEET